MQAENLKVWLAAARRGEKGETADKEGRGQEGTRERAENWARVVEWGTDGLQGWRFGRGGDLAGGSPYPQEEEGLT